MIFWRNDKKHRIKSIFNLHNSNIYRLCNHTFCMVFGLRRRFQQDIYWNSIPGNILFILKWKFNHFCFSYHSTLWYFLNKNCLRIFGLYSCLGKANFHTLFCWNLYLLGRNGITSNECLIVIRNSIFHFIQMHSVHWKIFGIRDLFFHHRFYFSNISCYPTSNSLVMKLFPDICTFNTYFCGFCCCCYFILFSFSTALFYWLFSLK